LPHFADGGGWKTQIVLVNPGETTVSGLVQFLGPTGQSIRTEPFVVAAGGGTRVQTDGAAATTQTGSVRISGAAGGSLPSAVSIFTYRAGGVTVTEAGALALASGTAFQVYAEASGTIRTGLAIANPSPAAVTVTLAVAGLTATLNIPGNGQTALFLNEIPAFASLPLPFQGVLRLTAPASVAVTGIRGRTNERGDFLVTTTAPVDESAGTTSTELLFPHFADGAGYSTQFVVFGRTTSGSLYVFSQSGQPATVLFQ
jgi:hypothetical protein